jgi:hypothetical protein
MGCEEFSPRILSTHTHGVGSSLCALLCDLCGLEGAQRLGVRQSLAAPSPEKLFKFAAHRVTILKNGGRLMEEVAIGTIEKYFGKIGVAAIKITSGELRAGDKIHVKGHSTDFEQTVESMQVEHLTVETAGPGTDVGIKVKEKVHEKDTVFVVKG